MKKLHSICSRVTLVLLPVLLILISTAGRMTAQTSGGCAAQFSYQVAPGSMNVYFTPGQTSNLATYSWNFGDGSTTSNLPTPQHLYLQPGAYRVCLTVTVPTLNGISCTAQWCDSVRVGSATSTCNPQFTWSSANVMNGIQFSPALNGSAAVYSWSFGDGAVSNTIAPSHVYATPGPYWVCLTVTNGTCVATHCDSVRVTSTSFNCDAHFSYVTPSSTSSRFYFYPVSNTTATRYSWSFGDGATDTVRTPNHSYSQSGAYWVCLTVTRFSTTGSVLCTNTWCDSIHVTLPINSMCDAHFTHQPTQQPNEFYFNPAANQTAANYYWTFGDGSTSTLRTPVHLYTRAGAYLACLTVTVPGINGGVQCTASWCDSVFISTSATSCSARFAWAMNNMTMTASFRPQRTTTGTVYSWTFGDGSGSTMMNPSHTYSSPGVYYACLTVTTPLSSAGSVCTDTYCDSVRVSGPIPVRCNASFSFSGVFNLPRTYSFNPAMVAPGTTYFWTFGDGDTSTLRTPVHTYADTGVYHVCLVVNSVTNSGTCSDTICRNVMVRPFAVSNTGCRAFFSYRPILSASGQVQFYSLSSSVPYTYHWDFGDSTTSNLSGPTHHFPRPGSYTVCLTISDSATHCFSRYCRVLLIGPSNRLVEEESMNPLAEAILLPNPASERAAIRLAGVSGAAVCEFYDLTGRMVRSLSGLTEGTTEFELSDFGPGIYLYRVLEADHLIGTGKFIVR